MTLEIRSLETNAEYKEIARLQHTIWRIDAAEVIPAWLFHSVAYNGGLVLGAFDEDVMVGFIFGVIGTVQGLDRRVDQIAAARLQLASMIMGVLPEYQSQNVGYRLKLAQREFALRMGLRLITWTYDPLESRNAWLNIGKLGAICHQYTPDFHGEMGGINAGLVADRFYVEWWVTSNRAQSRAGRRRKPLGYDQLIAGRATLVNEATFNEAGLPVPPVSFAESESSLILVEIPYHFQALKAQEMELARQWRAHTRVLFQHYFAHQFVVTDFARRQDEAGHDRAYYVLTYQHA